MVVVGGSVAGRRRVHQLAGCRRRERVQPASGKSPIGKTTALSQNIGAAERVELTASHTGQSVSHPTVRTQFVSMPKPAPSVARLIIHASLPTRLHPAVRRRKRPRTLSRSVAAWRHLRLARPRRWRIHTSALDVPRVSGATTRRRPATRRRRQHPLDKVPHNLSEPSPCLLLGGLRMQERAGMPRCPNGCHGIRTWRRHGKVDQVGPRLLRV